jgi:hypothetical protein
MFAHTRPRIHSTSPAQRQRRHRGVACAQAPPAPAAPAAHRAFLWSLALAALAVGAAGLFGVTATGGVNAALLRLRGHPFGCNGALAQFRFHWALSTRMLTRVDAVGALWAALVCCLSVNLTWMHIH